MKKIFILYFTVIAFPLFSQSSGNGNFKVQTTQEASYPGGEEELFKFFYKNLKYSEEAKAKYLRGDVMVSFFVEKDSTISGIRILNEPGYDCGKNVKELLQTVKYIPAVQNGNPARTNVVISIPMYAH